MSKNYYIAKSKIHGKGLMAGTDLGKGIDLGPAIVPDLSRADKVPYKVTPMGSKVNHSTNPNVKLVRLGDSYHLVTLKKVTKGTELVGDYNDTPVFVDKPKKDWKKESGFVHYVPKDKLDEVLKSGIKAAGRLYRDNPEEGKKALKRYIRFLTDKKKATMEKVIDAVRKKREHPAGEDAVYGFPNKMDLSSHERLKQWLEDRVPLEVDVERLIKDKLIKHQQNLSAPDIDVKKIPKIGPVLANQPHPMIIPENGVVPAEYLKKLSAAQEKVLYHGSPRDLDILEPRNEHGDPGVGASVFASPDLPMALAYLGHWADRDINQSGYTKGGKTIYTLEEMAPGALDRAYKDKTGYLYSLDPGSFVDADTRGSRFEVVSNEPVKPVDKKKIKDILKALVDAGVVLKRYNKKSKTRKTAIRRMVKRISGMEEDERLGYLKWVGETNPELAAELEAGLTKKSEVVPRDYIFYLLKKAQEKNMDEMEKWFRKRTRNHIDKVQANWKKVYKSGQFDSAFKNLDKPMEHILKHDLSKYTDPEYKPYVYITWDYKMKADGKKWDMPADMKKKSEKATTHHVFNNSHHPVFWDKSKKPEDNVINSKDRDKPVNGEVVDATAMPDWAVVEMVCDWAAVSQERKSSLKGWADKNIGTRWKFNKEQKKLIYDLVDFLEVKK